MPQLFPVPRPAVLAVLLASAWAVSALAASPAPSELVVRDAWVRQPPPGADTGAAYLTLSNVSDHPLTVTGFDSPVATMAMLHTTHLVSGQARMRPQATLVVAAGQTVTLKPDGLHVMLHGLKQPLQPGQHVPIIVSLADGRTITVSAVVRPLGSG